MKRIIVVLLILSAFITASCGSEKTPRQSEPTETKSLTTNSSTESVSTTSSCQTSELSARTVLETIKEAVKPKEDMITLLPGDDDYADSFEYLFDLDVKLTSDSAVCYCASGRLADEIDVFVLNDENDSDKMENALKKRANSRSSRYRGYYDAESDKAKNALVISKGKYVAFVISDDNNAAKKAFEDLF